VCLQICHGCEYSVFAPFRKLHYHGRGVLVVGIHAEIFHDALEPPIMESTLLFLSPKLFFLFSVLFFLFPRLLLF
jgi:hypothetical protein